MSGLTDDQIAEARRLYAENRTPSQVADLMSRFGRPKVTFEQVRAVVDRRKHSKLLDPEMRRQAIALRLTGITVREIHERLGGNFHSVKHACRDIKLGRKLGASEEALRRRRQRDAARNRRRLITGERRKAKPIPVPEAAEIEVPVWVPDHLHEFYEAIAQRSCEEQAASICRALKHGASVAHL